MNDLGTMRRHLARKFGSQKRLSESLSRVMAAFGAGHIRSFDSLINRQCDAGLHIVQIEATRTIMQN